MSNSKDNSSKQSPADNVHQEANVYEDEINLIDYFLVLGRHKLLIILGAVVPALLVGLFFYLSPRDYTITYTYDVKDQFGDQLRSQFGDQLRSQFGDQTVVDVSNWNLNEKNYNILLSRFYSKENLSRIINRLQQAGLKEYVESIKSAGEKEQIEKLVKFEVSPPYIDVSEVKETDATNLEQIRQLEALLLNVTITANSKKEISQISSVIRDNLENIMPVYLIAEQLKLSARELKSKMAGIEKGKFALGLALKNTKSVLAKLKGIKTETLQKSKSDIVLQFDVGGRSEYLPIEYQRQTAESKIIRLEETIRDNQKKYTYYENLLSLNEKLFAEVQNEVSGDYSIQQFRLFLLESAKEAEKEELKDYLSSYTKQIENRIAVSRPVTEKPIISAIGKGTVKKSGIVFAVALMMSVFASFLLEGLKDRQVQRS